MKFEPKKDLKRLVIVLVAAFFMALNIKSFVRTGGLFPGGISGLSLLIQRCFEDYLNLAVPYSVINILLNAVPIYIGFRFIGKKFTLFSLIMVFVSSIFTDILPSYVITYDILLISVFGGIITGICASLVLSSDATCGGSDLISIFISQKTGADSFNLILIFDVVILIIAGFLFGWDAALYSIIFQFACTQVMHVMYRNYQQQTLFVITEKPEDVCEKIFEVANHGATIFRAEGAYERSNKHMVYSIISGAQTRRVMKAVKKADPFAFINSLKTSEIRGNFFQAPKD